ncbi:ABC-2 type transport system ATP-binding protein [Kibdelosporangium phytohabitans]|nr:ABC-2 type transport system ATP-binding protein [Kibdelosporangium phytohabitans]
MPEAGLEIDRLSKRYGDVVALSDMTFEVRPGELFGFVGSNGAGKTTTMRIALGVLEADSGAVRWAGDPITLSTRRRFGYMPEERGLYPKMKVLDQLVYLAKLHGMPANDAHRAADDWIVRLGLRERRLDEVQKLSLGNQQRVQLAAALVHDPDVLVLDEPFSGLDPVAVDVMSQVLKEKSAAGIPVVFSSHQLDLVQRLCDRVGIVNKGTMVACDTVDALRSAGSSELHVHAPAAPPGWAAGIAGVTVVSELDGHTSLRVGDGVDDQVILRAALDTGPVHEFSRHRPSLADLFRDVVKEGR